MNKLLHAQIGNVVQNGIFNALNGNLSLKEAIIDILWGGFLFTIVGYIVHKFNF